MKKLTVSILASVALFSAPTFAVTQEKSFSQQLDMQKTQLRPQAYNFFSDRYLQTHVNKTAKLSFKAQLDSQKGQLRTQEFNPISDAYMQMKARQV
ncbi:hypothetical protein [Methylophaga sp.]|uniref:hypothetical protein n=1 Tax=Methylophaga sp. TaxID=2024840 RepID=UPI003F6A348D